MKKIDETFISADAKTPIHVRKWIPDEKPKAVLQIIHGMVEFVGRYSAFASYLTDHGYVVVGHDLLGHGESALTPDDYGYFGDHGNETLIADIHELRNRTSKEYPDIPYFILGHSMGSCLLRQYITETDNDDISYSEGLAGAIVMGTCQPNALVLHAGRALASLFKAVRGPRYRSKLINSIAFSSYNKKFKPARTQFDWLTKDTEIVDWYCEEEWCSFIFTVNAYNEMFKGVLRCIDKDRAKTISPNLAMLFVSGAEDPVGDFGEGVRKAYMQYVSNTKCIVDIKLYYDDRHEILNETDRDSVYDDIRTWLDERLEDINEL